MSRVLLITNPAASRTDPEVIRAVSAVFAREGWSVDVAGTTRPDHAGELARVGVAEGADVIAVYGGDGTTMQAVSGMVGHDVRLGLIPGGTGNVLAGNLRVPRDPEGAARAIIHGVDRSIDLGRVERPEGTRYFAVSGGAGFDADLMLATSGPAKRRWGIGAYVAQMWERVANAPRVAYRITVDVEELAVNATSVMVLNCGELIPPFVRLGPAISPDDGWLDVVVLGWTGVLESVGVLWQVLRGAGGNGDTVRYARGKRITIATDEPRHVQLDGDPTGTTPFTAEILPGALKIRVPK